MIRIYKYAHPEVVFGDVYVIEMQDGADIIATQQQMGNVVSWAIVDSVVRQVPRRFVQIPTYYSDEVPDSGRYLATIQMPDGIVTHVFEVLTGEVQ